MFSGPILTMAKTWKQPKCPSADELIRKEWIRKEGRYIYIYIYIHIHTHTYIHIHAYIYTKEYYSVIGRMKSCHLQQHEWT